jgi:hypothetical protein
MHPVNSKVFYFPQGHTEHAQAHFDFFALVRIPALILCRVAGIKYMADPKPTRTSPKSGSSLPKAMSFLLRTIVFLRAENGDLWFGIRRTKRGLLEGSSESTSGWNHCGSVLPYSGLKEEENKMGRNAFGNLQGGGARVCD